MRRNVALEEGGRETRNQENRSSRHWYHGHRSAERSSGASSSARLSKVLRNANSSPFVSVVCCFVLAIHLYLKHPQLPAHLSDQIRKQHSSAPPPAKETAE